MTTSTNIKILADFTYLVARPQDVIQNINNFLENSHTGLNFIEIHHPMILSYSHLHMHNLIYWVSKKIDTLLNITTGAEHSFLASLCDYFGKNCLYRRKGKREEIV